MIFPLIAIAIEYFDYVLFPICGSIIISTFKINIPFSTFALFSAAPIIRILAPFIIYRMQSTKAFSIIRFVTISMIASTTIIGLIPYGLDQKFYIIIFTLLRTIQIISFSLDMPTTATLSAQHEQGDQKTLIINNMSKTIFAATLGYFCALILISIMQSTLTPQQIENYAWRLPFVITAFASFALFRIRTQPKFQPQLDLEPINWQECASSIALLLTPAALIDIFLFLPTKSIATYSAQLIPIIASLITCITIWITAPNAKKTYSFSIFFLIFLMIIGLFTKPNLAFLIAWQIITTTSMICALSLAIFSTQSKALLANGLIYNLSFILVSPIRYLQLNHVYLTIIVLSVISLIILRNIKSQSL